MNELKKNVVQAIHDIMKQKMHMPAMDQFHEEARLNEDLYLDSILMLQLIIHLELDYGLDIPDEAIVPKHFKTVGTLADFLLAQQEAVR